ncbi:recombinase family protein [Microbacterium lacticum]
MATIGYARVSTRDQNPDGQTDPLGAAGCDKIFVEHASGTLAKRPALTEALRYLREGDSLVVTKLDRLGRSVRNLKQVADELQQRGVGLKALSQGIDTTTRHLRHTLQPCAHHRTRGPSVHDSRRDGCRADPPMERDRCA